VKLVNGSAGSCLVGGSGVLVNSCALFLLYQLLGIPPVIASALSVELAIANNYVLNDRWTFRQARRSIVRCIKFSLVSVLGMVLTAATRGCWCKRPV
jgi:putative flippase GtrA